MRACDHRMLTQESVAEVMEPDKVPASAKGGGQQALRLRC